MLHLISKTIKFIFYCRTKKSTQMVWTDAHDELLCREIISVDVFTGTKKGTTKRSAKWTMVVENLSNVETVHFKFDNRAVRDRYLTVILRTRVVYELIADEVRSTELAIRHIRRE